MSQPVSIRKTLVLVNSLSELIKYGTLNLLQQFFISNIKFK